MTLLCKSSWSGCRGRLIFVFFSRKNFSPLIRTNLNMSGSDIFNAQALASFQQISTKISLASRKIQQVIISAIVAMDKNRVIGKDNDMPWHLSDDFKYFKKTTLNHHIIMGRKCFESIGRPLPKRTNIILTRNPFYLVSNCLVMSSLEEALSLAEENGDDEPFICGGGQIYEMGLPFCDRLYITEVDTEVEGNKEDLIYFPEIDKENWEMVWEEQHPKDERHEHAFTFKRYERRSS